MEKGRRDRALTVGPVLQHPRTDGVTVLWETETETSGEVFYGVPGGMRYSIKDEHPAAVHRSAVTGLSPGRRYDYSVVGCGRELFRGSFRTLPERETYRVVILGDIHSPADGFGSLVPHIREADPDFIVILGDIVSSGREREHWQAFFAMAGDLFERIPFTAVVGNHDVKHETVLYDRYVGRVTGAPRGFYYFAAEVGTDYYLFLDSRNDHLSLNEAFWLIGHLGDLARRRDIRHVFVFSHIGPVSYKELRRGFIGLKPLLPFMGMAGVSAIFSGHDHHYLRGMLHAGFPFFISGGGGGKIYPVNDGNPYAWMVGRKQREAASHQFLVMEVADGQSTVRAVDQEGRIIDKVGLVPRAQWAQNPIPRDRDVRKPVPDNGRVPAADRRRVRRAGIGPARF